MITLDDDFITATKKVRKTGDSLVVGLSREQCEILRLQHGSMVQLFVKKITQVEETPSLNHKEETWNKKK